MKYMSSFLNPVIKWQLFPCFFSCPEGLEEMFPQILGGYQMPVSLLTVSSE